ncbi:MAG: hypothetical protein L6455_14955, partial [Kiritimatiellae bacterium]|nr:hypothetical protein [Verrucomicrobiota bacterium]MCG2681031.1 hypothetical protein [Kiritimatiellia bacterium]MBU4199868.1 hypothetical protein [Verrucomicrobiota bacterium]MBU4289813.1 hypothetical protein [Verrucomicrobiota bacterium]MBU4290801.1 hypothetical protein [Verrucomicrobiota bacterium]
WRIWLSCAGYVEKEFVNVKATDTDLPTAADFDGDGKSDPVIYASDGIYLWFSSSGYAIRGPYQLP